MIFFKDLCASCKVDGFWLNSTYYLCSNILGLKNMEENIRNNSFVFGFQKDRHFLCCKTILVPKWPYIAIVFSSFTSLFLKYFMIFTTWPLLEPTIFIVVIFPPLMMSYDHWSFYIHYTIYLVLQLYILD